MYWYSYSMTTWISRALDAALAGKLGGHVTDHEIGITALILWGSHPLTWVLAYCGVEGAVRLSGAAFSDSNLGTLPLFLIDKVFATIFRRGNPGDNLEAPAGSFAGAIRDGMLVATLPPSSDELRFKREGADEILEIHASRKKADWTPPRVVRYQNDYYRLEEFSRVRPPRPFFYVLRRLPAGVPGRSVLVYSPD
jgi:hypothetical protein